MRTNNRTNNLIKWLIILGDFVILNTLLTIAFYTTQTLISWDGVDTSLFLLMSNVAMLISEYHFPTIIHERVVGAGSILRYATLLIVTQTLLVYLLLRGIQFYPRVGITLISLGVIMWVLIVLSRFMERTLLKRFRKMGYNSRTISIVGDYQDIMGLYKKLLLNPTYGYKLISYYGSLTDLPQNGSVADFIHLLDTPEQLKLGDELYLCIPRNKRNIIERISKFCDLHMIKFYYVPLQEEALNLQSFMYDEIEVFTNYSSPLEDPLNKAIKRVFDIVLSIIALFFIALIFPIVAVIIKWQSPGPIFFKQLRTGTDGRDFSCYKFRSMHVNADADHVQATKDDPRKFPFGNFMRKTNIDELPQFWNVFLGNMSIVGPRPHMLAHTEQYSQLISQYMLRHFVKPGITGWAQVTGYRGETRELWQMEKRVECDIWYIQHWNFWLDIRIIWLTVTSIFRHDEMAY